MTTPDDAAIRTAVAAIWEQHHGTILAQIGIVTSTVEIHLRGSLDEDQRVEGHREAHKLAGSLGTFGFSAASRCASELELLLADPEALCTEPPERLAALATELRETVETAPVDDRTAPVAAPGSSDTPLVLVVEDDVALAERLAGEAARRGLRSLIAATPEHGRELAAGERPDLVLLDLTFDGETAAAYELLSHFTEGGTPIPVLVLTVRDVFTDRVEVARRGGSGFMPKSLSPSQAIDQVVQLIEREAASGTTLLAVDDDPAVLDVVRALLEPEGLRVAALSDPLRFWDELERVRPDMVMLDVDMPQVSGLELCRVIRNDSRWAAVPVLFLTSRRDEQAVREGFAAGADDYLIKPVIAEELVGRVKNRLERYKLHRFLAERDTLTNVPNRRSSTHGIERLLGLSRRLQQPLSIAVIDLDRFKDVNDRHGHAAGDVVLQRFGEILLQAFRGEDIVGRWGGEEFVVALYGMSSDEAVRRLQGLLAMFALEDFHGPDGQAFNVGFSAGVSLYPEDGKDVAALHRAADAALYQAKASGRGRVLSTGEASAAVGDQPDVVLVEDDEALAGLLLHELELRGHRVRWLKDGSAASAALAGSDPELRPSVVVLDVDLPSLDGVEVLRRLQEAETLRELSVIMLTARSTEDDLLETLELGAYDHVAKPFSLPVLMHKVAQAIDARADGRAVREWRQ